MAVGQTAKPSQLALLSQAKAMLAKANTVDEIKNIRDKAEAIRMYAKKQGECFEIQQYAAEVKLRAERKAGQLLSIAGLKDGRPSKKRSHDVTVSLADLGVEKMQSSRWQSIGALLEDVFESHVTKTMAAEKELTTAGVLKLAKTLTKAATKAAAAETARTTKLPNGTYHVIAADPPWNYSSRAEDPTHRAANPYPSMSVDAIKALNVEAVSHTDCVLWLWTTNAFMVEAHEVAAAWGFEVKTILTWAKDRMGTGDWLRGQTEHCLMAVRGKPVVTLTNQTTLLHGPMRQHSRKPDEFYELVEALCPGSKLEMFSREPREGWDACGAETQKFAA